MGAPAEDRVAQLERELAEQAAAYERALAQAHERLYWLDRWGLDLNELMARPWVAGAYGAAQRARRLIKRLGA